MISGKNCLKFELNPRAIAEAQRNTMNVFNVWISRMDGASRLRVEGDENAAWLVRRLSDFFVFKTSEPILHAADSSNCSFCIAYSSQISASRFEKLLAGIAEVKLMLEPAQAAFGSN
jgi:hypothetical protein